MESDQAVSAALRLGEPNRSEATSRGGWIMAVVKRQRPAEGSDALSVGKAEARLSSEVVESSAPWLPPRSAFAGFRFPTEVIVVAVRWYLRFNLSYRDVEELLVKRDVEADHVTVHRWAQRFKPLLADAARFCRHSPDDRWFCDETYVKVNGAWRHVYRAIDQYGQVIDVLVSSRRDAGAARRFFHRALSTLKGQTHRGGHRRRRGLSGRPG